MAVCTVSTSGGNVGSGGGFSAAQIGYLIYNVNYWGINANPIINPNTSGTWTVPCDATGGNCVDSPVQGSADDTGSCTFCWTTDNPRSYGTQDQGQCANAGGTWANGVCTLPPNDTSWVTAYPNILFGSQGGRDTTYGVQCNETPILAGGRCGGSALYDLEWVNGEIGLPERVDRIGLSGFCYDINKNCSGDNANVENVFIDTYLHRIDRANLWPTGYQAAYGDLNKVNGDDTETWNINFKLCLPEFSGNNTNTTITGDPGAQSTGGVRINTTPIVIDGKDWAIYFKWETAGSGNNNVRDTTTGAQTNGSCTNSFFYISFIPWDVGTGVNPTFCATNWCCDFKQFIDYVGSQEFKDRVLGQNGFAPVAANKQGSGNQANWPEWVYNNVGRPPFVVDSPESYVLAGIQVGNELWYSPNNQESCICYEDVEFVSDAGTFGKSGRMVNEATCVTASCTAVAGEVNPDCDCTGLPAIITGNCGTSFVVNYTVPAGATGVEAMAFEANNVMVTTSSATSATINAVNCTLDESGTFIVRYLLNDEVCFCEVPLIISGDAGNTGCVNGVSDPFLSCPQQLVAGESVSLTVTGCCVGAAVTWTSNSPNVVFSNPSGTTTNVTASITGNYSISVSCCDQ